MTSKKTYLYSSDFTKDGSYTTFDNTWYKAFRYTVPQNVAIKLSKDRPLNLILTTKEVFTGTTDEVTVIGDLVAGSKYYYDTATGIFAFKPSYPFVPATMKNTQMEIRVTSGQTIEYVYKLDEVNSTSQILYFNGDDGLTIADSRDVVLRYLPTNGTIRLVIVNPDAETTSMTKVVFEQSVSEFNLVTPFDPLEVMSLIEEITLIDYYHLDLYMKANWELNFDGFMDIFQIPIIKQSIVDNERRQIRPIVEAQFMD